MTKHKLIFLICVMIAVMLSGAATLAQAKPNFTGEWSINAVKSDFGPLPLPGKYIRNIEHNEPNLKYTTTQSGRQGEYTTDLTYTTDGKECINTVRDSEAKGAAKWDGDTLMINSTFNYQGSEISFEEKWTLSEDGKTITIATHIGSYMGEADLTIVLDKQ